MAKSSLQGMLNFNSHSLNLRDPYAQGWLFLSIGSIWHNTTPIAPADASEYIWNGSPCLGNLKTRSEHITSFNCSKDFCASLFQTNGSVLATVYIGCAILAKLLMNLR